MSVSVRWLDHTAIAVHNIEASLPFYRDVLGGTPGTIHHHTGKNFSTLTLRFPHGGGIELIAPYGDSGFMHTYLAKHGEGVHHITFLVEDLKASVAEARAAGVRVVDENYDNPDWREAFISPRSANGTIVQLAQTNYEDFEGRIKRRPADAGDTCPTEVADAGA
jgi:methylmalonyl-CoA/ethylmalonyl-CoA epimerase